jgi:hypothetical protein
MRKWSDENDLWLLTEQEYNELPDGTVLECISGEIATKGKDYIDMDTRGGCIAYGLTPELVQKQGKEIQQKFIIWKIKV